MAIFALAVSHAPTADGAQDTNSNDGTYPQPEGPNTTFDEKAREEVNLPRQASHGVPLTMSATIHEDDHQSEASLDIDPKQMLTVRLVFASLLFFTFWLVRRVTFFAQLSQIVFRLEL